MKLFLYSSYLLSTAHRDALHRLVGKPPKDITFAAIEHATDVDPDAGDWISDSRNAIALQSEQIEVIDLQQWKDNLTGLRAKLARKDVLWMCGGNAFYLRWILKVTGADAIIRDLVGKGTVYAGWSAGAIIAGPTLRSFDSVEDLTVVPEVFFDALNLTNVVVVPHMDVQEFAEGMRQIDQQLRQAGFRTAPLTEAQALIVQENKQQIIENT